MFEIGSSLRDARVRQGLDVADVEAETKIRSKYIRALEDERFDLLPGDAYVKGFLRTYADRLGLDGQLYVDEYNARFALSAEPVLSPRPRRKARNARLESNAVLVALAGIVAVTVLVIAAWQLGSSTDGEPGTVPVGTSGAVETGTAELPTTTAPVATTAEDAEPLVELRITAVEGRSVVEVRRGTQTGELLFEGTMYRDESEEFSGKRLWVRATKAEHLDLSLDGVPVTGLELAGPVLLRVTAEGVVSVGAP
ncbi:MAG: helix-turn-helix domain-containing protein [Thermoleophilia bacterium]|nr:helix-turn-helix domain-containing protein [Thermoleophilia bacterium]